MSFSFPTMAAIRYGYGFRPGENPPEDPDALILQSLAPHEIVLPFTARSSATRREIIAVYQRDVSENRKRQRISSISQIKNPKQLVTRPMQQLLSIDRDDRLANAVTSPHQFHERLSAFWTDHFSTSTGKSAAMRVFVPLQEAEAIRPNVAGPFHLLLAAAVLHPAMMIYLDQNVSMGPESIKGRKYNKGSNENLARELIELHTMGAGSGYGQSDVANAAMVLTGLFVDRNHSEVSFDKSRAQPGIHVVLDKYYGGQDRTNGDVFALLNDLAHRPETAMHICRKLAVHFIADSPPKRLVEAMAEMWRKTEGDLSSVYRVMVTHKDGFEIVLAKAKKPLDFIASSLRAIGATSEMLLAPKLSQKNRGSSANTKFSPTEWSDDGSSTATALEAVEAIERLRKGSLVRSAVSTIRTLGQPIWQPPSPAGWSEKDSDWISGGSLSRRIAWARFLGTAYGGGSDPVETLRSVMKEAARDNTIRAVSRAPRREVGLSLLLASPEFNRS